MYGAYLIASERTKIEPTIDSDDRLGVGRLGVKGNGGSSDCGAHLGYCLYDGFWHSRSDRLGELERFGGCEEEAEHRVGLCRVRMDDSQRRGTSFPFPSWLGVRGTALQLKANTCNSRCCDAFSQHLPLVCRGDILPCGTCLATPEHAVPDH